MSIKYQGFVKWIILNKVVTELHPEGHSLYQIVKNQLFEDHVYLSLLSCYKDQFLNLISQEDKSIHLKFDEYKDLLRKAVQLTFLFKNMRPESISDLLSISINFIQNIPTMKQKYGKDYSRIEEWDQLCSNML